MELAELRAIIDIKKRELREVDEEYTATVKQLKSKKVALESQIAMFETQINRQLVGSVE